ncbi:MAG: cellulase family glycosylhydrolase [Clostridiaceae bacterium]|nr:cellulase family glycosylhydrolase [Clostridiaceae bacterium]
MLTRILSSARSMTRGNMERSIKRERRRLSENRPLWAMTMRRGDFSAMSKGQNKSVKWLSRAIAAIVTAMLSTAVAQASTDFAILDRGLNLDWWVSATPVPPDFSASQLNEIHAAGFRHLRVPLNPHSVAKESEGNNFTICGPDAPISGYLQSSIPAFAHAGLAMVLVIEPSHDPAFLNWLVLDRSGRRLADLVGCLITNAEKVDMGYAQSNMAFGLMNEPRTDAALWYPAQTNAIRLLKAEHAGAKLIATPVFPTGVAAILAMPSLSVPGVAVELHYYEPYEFTFQGDPHQGPWMATAHGIGFGTARARKGCDAEVASGQGGPDSCLHCADDPNGQLCASIRKHDLDGFGRARIAASFKQIVAWAGGTPVYLGEYGVHMDWDNEHGADRVDAAEWLRTVTSEARQAGFGAAIYELGCGFGLVRTRICNKDMLARSKTLDLDPMLVKAVQ